MRRSLLPLILASLCLSGCYSLHAATNQLGILVGRDDIDDVLEEETDAERRRKLELVLDARRFGIESLGLAETGSYTCVYDTGGQPIAWNVSASDPDCFAPYAWSFPFVGTLPYIGFFEQEMAQEQAEELRAQGLDTLVLPVPAYSTLGWFDDPVFSQFLDENDEGRIVEVILHEIAHATVWIDEDAEFNENLATFIGVQGAKEYFRARGGSSHPTLAAIEQEAADSAVFQAAMAALREDLQRIYESSGPLARKLELKRRTIARFRERFSEDVRPRLSDDGYDWIVEPRVPLNNALLLQFRRYNGELAVFEALFERCGRDLARTVRALRELEEEEDPRAALARRVGLPIGK